MPREYEDILSFRRLFSGRLINVTDYRCSADRGKPQTEEESESNDIVLMRDGVFCRHFGKNSATADVNHVTFFSQQSSYQISHPADCGDRGTVLQVSSAVLSDIMREFDNRMEEPKTGFPFQTAPCNPDIFWRHRQLILALENVEHLVPEQLWIEEAALQLVATILRAAAEHSEQSANKARRQSTVQKRGEQVEAAKIYLASHLGDKISLDEVAGAVHSSPFHLSRVFQQQTGVSVHRYLTQLRLRASLERLCAARGDLGNLALDLGFSSHSHFADAFHREFGMPPSQLRQNMRLDEIRELSKILKV